MVSPGERLADAGFVLLDEAASGAARLTGPITL